MQSSSILNTLTAGEMAAAEKAAGISIATLEDPNFSKVAILGALAWVYARRDDASLKYSAYMDSHTLQEVTEVLGLDADAEADADEE